MPPDTPAYHRLGNMYTSPPHVLKEHTHTRARARARAPAHARMHTHTHTHTPMYMYMYTHAQGSVGGREDGKGGGRSE